MFQKQGKKLHRGGKDVWSDFKVKVRCDLFNLPFRVLYHDFTD